jgi:hypothetical protein
VIMLNENLREQIGRLRALAPELNAVTDKAAFLIQSVEKFLDEECKFALSAHTVMSAEPISPNEEDERWLEYTRVDGKFHICVTDVTSDPSGDYHTHSRTIWSSCHRELKLQTVDHIPYLLKEIAKKVENTINSGRIASERVDQYLRDMEVSQ